MPCRAAASRTASGDGSGASAGGRPCSSSQHARLLEEALGSRRLHDREEASGDRAGVPVAVGDTGSGMHRAAGTDGERVRSPFSSPVNSSSPSRT